MVNPSNIKAIVFDMDGILRIGDIRTPYANRMVDLVNRLSLRGMIVTNECRYSVETIRRDLHQMGVMIPNQWKIHTSGVALRDFLAKQICKIGEIKQVKIGIVGGSGLEEVIVELQNDRVKIIEFPEEGSNSSMALFLVIGIVENLQVEHLEKVLKWTRVGAHVIVTSPDIIDPEFREDFSIAMPRHLLHMVRLNENTSEYFSVGKPNAWMMRAVRLEFSDLRADEILFVGDTLATDIKMAEEHDLWSALVLTGNTVKEDLQKSVVQPDLIFDNLGDLIEWLTDGNEKID